MNNINKFVVSNDCYTKLSEISSRKVENLFICSFSYKNTKGHFYIDDIIETPSDAYLLQSKENVQVDPRYIKYILSQFKDKDKGIIYGHNHLNSMAIFSKNDIKYGEKLIKTTFKYVKNKFNGLLLLSQNRYSIKIYNDKTKKAYNKFNSNIKKLER